MNNTDRELNKRKTKFHIIDIACIINKCLVKIDFEFFSHWTTQYKLQKKNKMQITVVYNTNHHFKVNILKQVKMTKSKHFNLCMAK